MVKFVFTTQSNRTTRYNGPSGAGYVINQGFSFEVTNPMDIAFFDKNSRFKRVILPKKPEPVKPEKLEEDWLAELQDIWGISRKMAGIVFELYPRKDALIEALEMRYKLGPEIPKKREDVLRKHFLDSD